MKRINKLTSIILVLVIAVQALCLALPGTGDLFSVHAYAAGDDYAEIYGTFPEDALTAVMNGLASRAERIDIEQYKIPNLNQTKLSNLLSAVRSKYPLEFVAAGADKLVAYSIESNSATGFAKSIRSIQYPTHPLNYSERLSFVRDEAEKVRVKTEGLSDYEKIIYVHDKILLETTYDNNGQNRTAYSQMTTGKGVCEAYASVFKMYMDYLGIPALIVTSDAMSHAWSAVNLDGSWYHIDLTWNEDNNSVTKYDFTLLNNNEMTSKKSSGGETHRSWSPYFASTSATYSNMPRVKANMQCIDTNTDRWYYRYGNSVYSCDYFGGYKQTVISYAEGKGIAINGGMLYYGSGDSICSYDPTTTQTRVLYSLSDAEKAKSQGRNYLNSEITAILAEGDKLSYKYNVWDKTGVDSSGMTFTERIVNGQSVIDLTAISGQVKYNVSPDVKAAASKLVEPWGIKFYMRADGTDADKISSRGMYILKDIYYSPRMTARDFSANPNAFNFSSLDNEGGGLYSAALEEGVYTYDIGANYYVLPYVIMNDSDSTVVYGTVKCKSMKDILDANVGASAVSQGEKKISRCILDLYKSVKDYYNDSGMPGTSRAVSAPRGSSQTLAAAVGSDTENIRVFRAASKLIEPWGIKFNAVYPENANKRGMVLLNGAYFDPSYAANPDAMRCSSNSFVYTDSDNTLVRESDGSYCAMLTEGISTKNIADVYYVVPFVVDTNGTYFYGEVKSKSMREILTANSSNPSVSGSERIVSDDILELYDAVAEFRS